MSYYLPAEWEKHTATWLAWPQNENNWPGKMQPVKWAFSEMITKISVSEHVYVACNNQITQSEAEAAVKAIKGNTDNVSFELIPTDYGWFRDCGPQYVLEAGEPVVIDFSFNAWAKYDSWQSDNNAPALCSEIAGNKIVKPVINGRQIVLEGGAIDVNGKGTILTTAECLLDQEVQVRNAGFNRDDYQKMFSTYFGADNTIWLNCGITGDDTHGHVDDLARFVNDRQIVAIRETDSADINYKALAENHEILQGARLEDGSKPEIIELPMPEAKHYRGSRLPASYANFYISNECVLVPTFNDPNDYKALGILDELFKGRKVCGIHAIDLVVGRGSVHCLTRQQPEKAQQ